MDNATAGIPQSPHFNQSLPSVIICHGFTEDIDTPTNLEMAKEIKSLGTSNVFICDHNSLTKENYYLASTNAQYAGEGLGKLLANFHTREENQNEINTTARFSTQLMFSIIISGGIKNFHLIGFSLGAHLVGFAGKQFCKMTGVKLNRITGLDPAGVCYFKQPADKRLDKSDATCVDIIHTDFGALGMSSSNGKCFTMTSEKRCSFIMY